MATNLNPRKFQAPSRAPDGNVLTHLLAKARPLVMGVLNVTPDSFSDGGRFLDPQAAIAHARQLAAEGADILDIGAEFDAALWRRRARAAGGGAHAA